MRSFSLFFAHWVLSESQHPVKNILILQRHPFGHLADSRGLQNKFELVRQSDYTYTITKLMHVWIFQVRWETKGSISNRMLRIISAKKRLSSQRSDWVLVTFERCWTTYWHIDIWSYMWPWEYERFTGTFACKCQQLSSLLGGILFLMTSELLGYC